LLTIPCNILNGQKLLGVCNKLSGIVCKSTNLNFGLIRSKNLWAVSKEGGSSKRVINSQSYKID